MVRLVFRPFTQIWRSICTSEPLRASTTVSRGFTLPTQSSPSFGSQHVCSHSDLSPEGLWPADSALKRSYHYYFHCAWEFVTPVLAHMLNSLVRVSRRGKLENFANITSKWLPRSRPKQHQIANSPRRTYILEGYLLQSKPMLAWPVPQRSNCKQYEKNGTEQHFSSSLPFQQFQVLFNSLFKVLCIFPSRYLYAIGLPPIFSFRWNLPPTLSCNPKQLDS